MSDTESLSFTCGHYTEVLNYFARFLECAGTVSNTMHEMAEDEHLEELASHLARDVAQCCEQLKSFLAKHDPDVIIARPELAVWWDT